MSEQLYKLPQGEYHPTFLRALAIAVHMELMSPDELTFYFKTDTSQYQISCIIQARIKDKNNIAGSTSGLSR